MPAPNRSDSVVPSSDLPREPMARPVGQSAAPALLHRGFIGAGAVLLMAALGTDILYAMTSVWQWSNFSAWLIAAGLIVMLLAGLLLIVDVLRGRAHRLRLHTSSFVLIAAAAVLSLVNAFVHSRDAWTSVVPQGIVLSAVSALLLLITGARGWAGARGWSLAISRAREDRS